MAGTLAEKVWESHVVRRGEGEPDLLYIDLHLLHEVTSPQAFDGLRLAGRPVRRTDLTAGHRGPQRARPRPGPITDPVSRTQVETLRRNCEEFGVTLLPDGRRRAGHRARRRPAARAHPAGHDDRLRRLATPRRTARSARWRSASAPPRSSTCSPPRPCRSSRSRRWRSPSRASCADGVTAKDIVLAVIAKIGTGGGQGYVLEYRGSAIRALSMEARMTVCNMSIEAGARAGHDRARRDHLRVPARPRPRPDRRRVGRRGRGLEPPAQRRRRRVRRGGRARRRHAHAVRHLGHQPRAGRPARHAPCPTPS